MKRIVFFLMIFASPLSGQWRNIGLGTAPGGAGGILTFGVHDTTLFASITTTHTDVWRYSPPDTWTINNNGLPPGITNFATQGQAFFAGVGKLGYRSFDYGKSWVLNCGSPIAATDSIIICSGTDWVYRSSDAGNNWVVTLCPAASVFGISSYCVLALTTSGVNLSTDNGINWRAISVPQNFSLKAFASVGSQLFAGGSGVFRSLDGGVSWNSLALVDHKVNALAASGPYLFAGTDTGVFISLDSGVHWRNVNDNLGANPKHYPNVKLLTAFDTMLFAEVDGGSIGSTTYAYGTARPISEMVREARSAVLTTRQLDDPVEVFPNPTSNRVTVQLGNVTATRIEVLNVLGASLQTVTPRQTEVTLDLSLLPSGTYFLLIETSKGLIYRKIARV